MHMHVHPPPTNNNQHNNSPLTKNPLEKATMSVLFSHTSLFCPSDKRRRNWKKGTMREARHGGFFFRSVFRSKCSDLVLRRPLLPVPWAMHT